MRVGILTFPNTDSYGASLQMYALYRTAEKLGISAEIINYRNAYMKVGLHTSASGKSRAKRILKSILHCRMRLGFRSFEGGMSVFPQRETDQTKLLAEIGKRYDSVICGSDQVWNPDITGSDLSYFLNFCTSKTRRIAYAPSFGREELPEVFEKKIADELKKFHRLSVREIEGREIIRKAIGKEVPLVLDPSFLMRKTDWMQLEKEHPAAKEPYILYYTVRSSDTLLNFCMELAEKKKMKVVIVGGNVVRWIRNKKKNIDYAWDIEPREWLYLLNHANCVVTNSFHGTAFSINYEKDFYVEFSSLTNSRLEHLVRATGLHRRVVREGCAPYEEHIEYESVNKVINELREESLEYLKEAILSEGPEKE